MIHIRLTTTLLAAAATGALLLTAGPVASADESTAEPSATATQDPSTQDPSTPAAEPASPVIAEYDGRKINLAESWEGADSCTELPSGEVHCYDTTREAQTDPALPASIRKETRAALATQAVAAAPDRCIADYWCLYADADYKGKIIRLSSSGKHDLSEWGFRDKVSSVYYWVLRWSLNYGTATIWDYRSGVLHDRQRDMLPPHGWANFKNMDYPGGGDWNDKVDAFEVKRA
ncbi:peptidase inhibitor family I36 protein [Streptomyces sp. NPDC005236]|uniref:peptidase inhibitor family I36 protein n=1 Tax=Streptomyces sp. NPDC005236 TaxID=3157028 RepID=UPI0033BAF9AC